MKCCVCFYAPLDSETNEVQDAVTVLGGYAVCEDHLGLVAQGTEWYYILKNAN